MASEAAHAGEQVKRRKLDYTGDAVVVALKNGKRITVQMNILCKSSIFFKAACSGDWKESNRGVVKIRDWDQCQFLTYLHWLYTGTLDVPGERWPTACAPNQTDRPKPTTGKIVHCYRLGDFIGDTRFCNILTDRMLEFWKTYWSTLKERRIPLPRVVSQARANSGMSRLMLDMVACSGRGKEELAKYPVEFRLMLAEAFMEERKTGKAMDPEKRDKCYYHDHKDDTDKCQD